MFFFYCDEWSCEVAVMSVSCVERDGTACGKGEGARVARVAQGGAACRTLQPRVRVSCLITFTRRRGNKVSLIS